MVSNDLAYELVGYGNFTNTVSFSEYFDALGFTGKFIFMYKNFSAN